eukprot:TRINITY_DN10287_c0_g1_i1.p1 TRINITY_DN10287_c0_g1~~TRINITY_DN10287_c0_g1_i1.p1  ORF type:complete len:279 (-),score=55.65 TRINITY_DN10287_c0_g1_i1:12-848(-)
MPKRKTNAAKKAEKRKNRQKELNTKWETVDITVKPCNADMECDQCFRRQKNRAFCYFCGAVQRLPMCAHCGRTKCLAKSGDCLVKHGTAHVTGMALVGSVCDICEAWVCHSKKCTLEHSCPCPLDGAECIECERSLWDHGGRMYNCGTCGEWICDDDQFEHQASCEIIEAENFDCASCKKVGVWICMRCKVCYCDDHCTNAITKNIDRRKEELPCKKCRFPLKETKYFSVSTKSYDFGRKTQFEYDQEDTSFQNSIYYQTHFGGNDEDWDTQSSETEE